MNARRTATERTDPKLELRGYCHLCGKEHTLAVGDAKRHCSALMEQLSRHRRLDFHSLLVENPLFSTDPLFGEARGKMFGVLEGVDQWGKSVLLYAFSGQFNGLWYVPGWAPPLFDIGLWYKTNDPAEKEIKSLSAYLQDISQDEAELRLFKKKRKELSRQLMSRLHALYTIRNFNNQTATLASFYKSTRGIPTGAGDCCAPKLLIYAMHYDIVPIGIAEFFWGRTTRSAARSHGRFYPSCSDKCLPLMGFLLCGLPERQQRRGCR